MWAEFNWLRAGPSGRLLCTWWWNFGIYKRRRRKFLTWWVTGMVVNGIKLNRIIFQCVCEWYSINTTSHSQETAEATHWTLEIKSLTGKVHCTSISMSSEWLCTWWNLEAYLCIQRNLFTYTVGQTAAVPYPLTHEHTQVLPQQKQTTHGITKGRKPWKKHIWEQRSLTTQKDKDGNISYRQLF